MEIARWDELELVRRCREGSESAFAELVRRHRPRLFTLAYRLLGDRDGAEDVVQETFVAAFRALDRFEPRPSLSAWLNTIAVRNAGKAVARRTSRPRTSLDAMLDDEGTHRVLAATATEQDDPHLAAEAAELRREVAAAISVLPFKYRAAVVTRFILGLDYAEAAASLEMGLNTYKSQLLRGTRMLRDLLAPATGREAPAPQRAEPAPATRPAIAAATAAGGAPLPARPPIRSLGRGSVRAFAEPQRTRFESVAKENAFRG